MDLTLVVMAAGMGSRYGGLKQLDSFGPNGESIIHYSVYDAIRAGFNRVVFIIREDFAEEFKQKIGSPFADKVQVDYAFQSLEDLPAGFSVPEGREKPWGTGQAVLCAAVKVSSPFVVINGDDFYGAEAFQRAADFYKTGSDKYSMVAFETGQTLSDFGGVTRGLCYVEDGKLTGVKETGGLRREGDKVISDDGDVLEGHEPVSMNMWGFTPRLFTQLGEGFVSFLEQEGQELKSEYLLPQEIDGLIKSGKESVQVLNTGAKWFGVTYQLDREYVSKSIADLVASGTYPQDLW